MKKSLPFLLILIIAGVLLASGKKNDTAASEERKRKADYIFMESQARYADDYPGDYFHLLKHAGELDSTEIFYDEELGYFMLVLSDRESDLDSTVFNDGLRMFRKAYEANPDDLYAAMRYASLMQHFGFYDESLRAMARLKEKYPNKPEISFNYAQLLFHRGDSSSIHHAINVYEELERSQGHSLGLTQQKVAAYVTLRDTASAIDELHRLIQFSPKSSENQLYAGDVFTIMQKNDSALLHYNKALELDSANGQAYYRLADYYRRMGDSIGYDREVFNALSQANLEVPEKIELMRGYIQNLYTDEQQRPRIERLFEILTTLHPLEPEIRDLYSVYLAVTGDYERSAEQTAIYLGLNPAEKTNWNRLISLYLTLDKSSEAIEAGKEAMHYFPDDATIKLITSSAYMMKEMNDSAISLLEAALTESDPADLETLSSIETSLGDIFYKDQLVDSAFVHYERALEYNPRNLMAMNNYAYFLACRNENLTKAESLSYLTIKDEPKNPVYLDTYAWILFKQKNYEGAKEYIDLTMEYDSEPSADLLEHAGDIYFMNLLPVEAMEFWKEALELNPDNELLKRKIKERIYIPE